MQVKSDYSCNITLTKARGTKNRNYWGQKKPVKLYTENKQTLNQQRNVFFVFENLFVYEVSGIF